MNIKLLFQQQKLGPWKIAVILLSLLFVGIIFFETLPFLNDKPTQRRPLASEILSGTSLQSNIITPTTPSSQPPPPSSHQKEFTIWSTSYHISPIECLRDFLENEFYHKTGKKVKIINKSISGHCHIPRTCARNLKVLDSSNGGSTMCNAKIGERLFEAYKQDDEFSSVDLIMCDHNIAMCELYMPFNKPMILQSTTRYEAWRHGSSDWKAFNENLERIVSKPYNSLVANNLYDAKYVEYFSGLKVPVFDSFCAYSTADDGRYNPTRAEFLVGPSRSTASEAFFAPLNSLIQQDGNQIQVKGIRQLYRHYKYSDLASHPAIILIPYQVSVMSLFEYYRMNIPMYAPSLELLNKWHVENRLLSERTWHLVGSGELSKGSPADMKMHPNANLPNFDPNNDVDPTSLTFWNQYADFYQWPNIITFNSWEDLFAKLKGTSLQKYREISGRMALYNQEVSESLIKKWSDVIERAESKKDRNQKSTLTFQQAMKQHWGMDVNC